jgi:hypothetical protein
MLIFQEKYMRNRWLDYLLLVALLTVFSACSTLNPAKINYNQEKQIYEYPIPPMAPVALRTDSGKLVTNENYTEFVAQLSRRNFRYPLDQRIEIANSLKDEDLIVAGIYAETADKIRNGDYSGAKDAANRLRMVYPPSVKFTDIAFLEGYAYEKSGDIHKADEKYEEFLSYSSQKYSERFRGYLYADKNDELWKEQRRYAAAFPENKMENQNTDFIQPLHPKYYRLNLQPGYTLSDDGLEEHKRGIISLSAGRDFDGDIALGAQYYRNLTKGFDINPVFSISKNLVEFNLALPLQIYKAENNRFGLKLSPFVNYMFIKNYDSVYPDNSLKQSVFNFGAKASAGYYFVQKLSLGAYYTWHYYNENNPMTLTAKSVNVWWNNEYDISLYYNLIKGLSLKSGIKSGNWVAGFYMTGWEVSYDFQDKAIIVRTELY